MAEVVQADPAEEEINNARAGRHIAQLPHK
jgi:hypothetical protein